MFHQNVRDDDQESEEGDLDDVSSVMSPPDSEGFLEEVECSDIVDGESGDATGGKSSSQSQQCPPHTRYYNTSHILKMQIGVTSMGQMGWRRDGKFFGVFTMKEHEGIYQKWVGKLGERKKGLIEGVAKQDQTRKRL